MSIHVFILLTQNENVQRGHTNERTYVDIKRPNRRTPLKVLVEKTFRLVRRRLVYVHAEEHAGERVCQYNNIMLLKTHEINIVSAELQ